MATLGMRLKMRLRGGVYQSHNRIIPLHRLPRYAADFCERAILQTGGSKVIQEWKQEF